MRVKIFFSQFKEIAQAYEVLSDEKKRKLYDEGGQEALKEGGMRGSGDARDFFSSFFGGGSSRRDNRTKDMIHPLRVSARNPPFLAHLFFYLLNLQRLGRG